MVTYAGESFEVVSDRMGLKDSRGFGIFEVYNNSGNNIVRKLVPKDNLADAMAKAESVQKQMRGKNMKISFSFVFKKAIFWNNKETYIDDVERNLMFHQVIMDKNM